METSERKQLWLDRLFEYDADAAKVAATTRGFYKAFLEFIRNCMVIAALAFVAQKSGNWFLYAVAGLAYLALASTLMSYSDVWKVELDFLGQGRGRAAISALIGVIVLHVIQAAISVSLFGAIYKIVQTQGS